MVGIQKVDYWFHWVFSYYNIEIFLDLMLQAFQTLRNKGNKMAALNSSPARLLHLNEDLNLYVLFTTPTLKSVIDLFLVDFCGVFHIIS